jgi:hypothetical protein
MRVQSALTSWGQVELKVEVKGKLEDTSLFLSLLVWSLTCCNKSNTDVYHPVSPHLFLVFCNKAPGNEEEIKEVKLNTTKMR